VFHDRLCGKHRFIWENLGLLFTRCCRSVPQVRSVCRYLRQLCRGQTTTDLDPVGSRSLDWCSMFGCRCCLKTFSFREWSRSRSSRTMARARTSSSRHWSTTCYDRSRRSSLRHHGQNNGHQPDYQKYDLLADRSSRPWPQPQGMSRPANFLALASLFKSLTLTWRSRPWPWRSCPWP